MSGREEDAEKRSLGGRKSDSSVSTRQKDPISTTSPVTVFLLHSHPFWARFYVTSPEWMKDVWSSMSVAAPLASSRDAQNGGLKTTRKQGILLQSEKRPRLHIWQCSARLGFKYIDQGNRASFQKTRFSVLRIMIEIYLYCT